MRNQYSKKYGLTRGLCLILTYDFEAIVAPLNKHPTEDLMYLSRYIHVVSLFTIQRVKGLCI